MKKSKKLILLSLLELLFVAIIPLVIVCIGYGGWEEEAKNFKIGFGAILFIIILLYIVKKVIITPYFDKQKIKTGNLLAQLEIETDAAKIANIENALKKSRLLETVFAWLLPALVLIAAFFSAKALERAIVTFSGILFFVGISEFIGFIFACLVAYTVDSKNK